MSISTIQLPCAIHVKWKYRITPNTQLCPPLTKEESVEYRKRRYM